VEAASSISIPRLDTRATSLFLTLVENSLRHGAGAVRLEAITHDEALELRVGDDGAGFPSAFIAQAFGRFSRANGSRPTTGAGLGLAIVAAIAHAHGGSTTASNRSNGGAEVTLRLPRSRLRRCCNATTPFSATAIGYVTD